ADVKHGWKMIGSLRVLWFSKAIRLLMKETGAKFSEIVEAWVAYADPDWGRPLFHAEFDEIQRSLTSFIGYYCERNRIEPDFFVTFARREFPSHEADYRRSL
ncbi:MAG TPA: hypothetical protein VFV50_08025, partial [Bdellovibrionales bacterium]|nr:hypothetical protein [Bdellovibrionales bacterium]